MMNISEPMWKIVVKTLQNGSLTVDDTDMCAFCDALASALVD